MFACTSERATLAKDLGCCYILLLSYSHKGLELLLTCLISISHLFAIHWKQFGTLVQHFETNWWIVLPPRSLGQGTMKQKRKTVVCLNREAQQSLKAFLKPYRGMKLFKHTDPPPARGGTACSGCSRTPPRTEWIPKTICNFLYCIFCLFAIQWVCIFCGCRIELCRMI